jgi:hypothetical protein
MHSVTAIFLNSEIENIYFRNFTVQILLELSNLAEFVSSIVTFKTKSRQALLDGFEECCGYKNDR